MKPRRSASLLLVVLVAGSFVASRMATPAQSGSATTPLAPCPPSPNCVCSEDPDSAHRIPALAFSGPPADAMVRLRTIIRGLPRTRVVTDQDGYMHVEFRTRILRFVDDVEFRWEPGAQTIQVRSASRLGYSDLGTNRRRVEAIRDAFVRASP